jgi:hypothetical protein
MPNLNEIQELDTVAYILNNAFEEGLEAEVVVFALKHMKENPNTSIIDAMKAGYEDWIK